MTKNTAKLRSYFQNQAKSSGSCNDSKGKGTAAAIKSRVLKYYETDEEEVDNRMEWEWSKCCSSAHATTRSVRKFMGCTPAFQLLEPDNMEKTTTDLNLFDT